MPLAMRWIAVALTPRKFIIYRGEGSRADRSWGGGCVLTIIVQGDRRARGSMAPNSSLTRLLPTPSKVEETFTVEVDDIAIDKWQRRSGIGRTLFLLCWGLVVFIGKITRFRYWRRDGVDRGVNLYVDSMFPAAVRRIAWVSYEGRSGQVTPNEPTRLEEDSVLPGSWF